MKNQTIMNRKSAKKLLMVQWSRFQNVCIELEGSTLVTGVNGSGKSTVLDAMTYLLTGNTQFNKAAKDRDRTVLGYVRGDTRSNGEARYFHIGSVVVILRCGIFRSGAAHGRSMHYSSASRSAAMVCPGAAITVDFTRPREVHHITSKMSRQVNAARRLYGMESRRRRYSSTGACVTQLNTGQSF